MAFPADKILINWEEFLMVLVIILCKRIKRVQIPPGFLVFPLEIEAPSRLGNRA